MAIADVDDPRHGPDPHPEALELAPGGDRGADRIRGQDAIERLDQQDDRLLRADGTEVPAQRVVGDLADRSGQLDPGRATTDDDEGHPFRAAHRVRLALRGLEGDEDPAADLDRVIDRLETRRERRPGIVTEVGEAGAGGDDERVVVDRPAVREHDTTPDRVDLACLAEQHGRVLLAAQDAPQGLGDLARGQGAGRDLVQERLEEVEVPAIDERDLDTSVSAEALGSVQATEATTDDDDPVARRACRIGRRGDQRCRVWTGSDHLAALRPSRRAAARRIARGRGDRRTRHPAPPRRRARRPSARRRPPRAPRTACSRSCGAGRPVG